MDFIVWLFDERPWLAAMLIFWLPWPAAFLAAFFVDRVAVLIADVIVLLRGSTGS